MYKLYCRIYQNIFKLASAFLPWRKPELLEGINSLQNLPEIVKNRNINKVLIVTGPHIFSSGLLDVMLKSLEKEGVTYYIYNKTVQNPTIVKESLLLAEVPQSIVQRV